MKSIEIPHEADRTRRYRFFEILPGALSWFLLAVPFILSFINVSVAAFFILGYILIFLTRSMAGSLRALGGYRTMREHAKIDWNELVEDLEKGEVVDSAARRPKWHYDNLLRMRVQTPVVEPSELYHAIIIATVKEGRDILEPTIQAVINSEYDMKRVILLIAYEGRAGEETESRAKRLVADYAKHFHHAHAVEHPFGIPGEVIGKGGNITYAGRYLQQYLAQQHIDPLHVAVTTLDADNRPDKKYLSALTYYYCAAPDPVRASFQPLAMFTNNIWDAPAPMRVIATGNNFYYMIQTQRPHLERNFSAHAQSMRALIDMDFWSVRTVVEDGHHFWRSYFFYDGDYRVYPMSIPIYQDAVLAETYLKTLKAQFIQHRRWTYGASDIAYIANQGFFKKSKTPKFDMTTKFLRALEGHVSWATNSLLLAFAGFIPALFNSHDIAAYELPIIISRVQTVGILGIMSTLFVALKTLPPRPPRYKRHRTIFMVLQWAYMPITTIAFGSLAALNSQTRLMFGWYLSKFDVTDKAVKK